MNVLFLTPDAVGSTLLQRLLTIYMQFHEFDQPVINLHELTNGLDKFYSPEFNSELITRRKQKGYYQTLSEIVDLLDSVDHYKIARLAQYHIVNRNDSLADQMPFYRYLNDNFYIVSCRRQNLLEHALSHALTAVSKKLNVYTPQEKISSYYGLYKSGIEIQRDHIIRPLTRYRDYLTWCDQHFFIGSYFVYEQHLPQIEKYILNLPVFGTQKQKITWKNTFDIEFEQWNRCHFYHSDIGSLALNAPETLLQLQNSVSNDLTAINAPTLVQQLSSVAHKTFLETHKKGYQDANSAIQRMQQLGIINTSVPIKKQTLIEKLHMVKNLEYAVDVFNEWLVQNPGLGDHVDIKQLREQAESEHHTLWNPATALNAAESHQLPIVK